MLSILNNKTRFLLLASMVLFSFGQNAKANFFADSVTTEQLRSEYKAAKNGGEKIRILLVPGHDADSWGTEYKKIKEADLNYQLTAQIQKLFSTKKEFEIVTTRNKDGYLPEFASYFEDKRAEITQFRKESKETFSVLENVNLITTNNNVYHNTASEETANRLFGISKWANENKIDIVLHIHFNDTPERKANKPGQYNGFVVYVSDGQFSNGKASMDFGLSLYNQISKYFPTSDANQEFEGVIQNQKLIALGSSNTLKPAAALVEYGFIYEPQIVSSYLRTPYFKEMAQQTVLGIENYLANTSKVKIATLPYKWKDNIKFGAKGWRDVFALQLALKTDKFFPPYGKTENECTVNGTFGKCTSASIIAFKKKYKIDSEGSTVDLATREKLNELYYNKYKKK